MDTPPAERFARRPFFFLAAKPMCGHRVMVLDEPFAAVDAQTRADLEDPMLRLWSELDLTVIFATHDIDEAV
jgi:ABC-type nitrate/sulfonate/bicarbonate transport system ATPase subunit